MDLLTTHVETLYTRNAEGDLLTSNEPWEPDRRRAPPLFLSWSASRYLLRFREDVPADLRREIAALAAARWPFVDAEHPPGADALLDLLGDLAPRRRLGGGPAYVCDGIQAPAGEVCPVTRANAHVLARHFGDDVDQVDALQPCTAVLEDGHTVSVCQTVRRSPLAIEAGVNTVEGHRRRGYARRVVAAWAAAARREGRIAFYSTARANTASRGVAASLGLRPFAMEFSVA